MDRDTILASFQEISQIQDFEECIQILESVNWDLQSAINNIDQLAQTPIVETRMDYSITNFRSIRDDSPFQSLNKELIFDVEIKGKMIRVVIFDIKTIGDLTRMIANEINEPNTRLNISGLKKPYKEDTVLRVLNLPSINHVVATVIDPQNSLSAASSSNQISRKSYHLSIQIHINGEFSQVLPLVFNGSDSVYTLKSHLAHLTGTDISDQRWTDRSVAHCAPEKTLQESGVSETESLTVYIDIKNKTPRKDNECSGPRQELSANNSREMDNEDDDYDDDFPDDMDLQENETEVSKRPSATLMDANAHLDPVGAVLQFSQEFTNRYCSTPNSASTTSRTDCVTVSSMTPPFFPGSIEDAISSTLNLPPHERKPLFLYLHHGESIQANIFCTQILCYSEVCLFFLQSDYTIWPWDVTYSENKTKLISWITRNFGAYASSALKIITKDQYPVLVVISKSQGVTEIMEIIDGVRTKEETVSHLWDIKSKFEDNQLPDIRAWEERQLRDLVKQEQDEAYRESLLQDQHKEKLKQCEDNKVRDAALKAEQEKEKVSKDRRSKITNAVEKVPSEPDEGADTVTIRLRAPTNVEAATVMTRRFLYEHTLANLVAYMESLGYLRTEFRLLMSYPRKNLTEMTDHSVTLRQLGIPKRETLILERL